MKTAQRQLGLLLWLTAASASASLYAEVSEEEAASRLKAVVRQNLYFLEDSSESYRARARAGGLAIVEDSPSCSSCLRVTNISTKDQFLVQLTLRFDEWGGIRKLHIPYLPARSSANINIWSIVPSGTRVVNFSGFAEASLLSRSTAERLLRPANVHLGSYEAVPTSGSSPALHEVLSQITDAKDFKQIAAYTIPAKGGLNRLVEYVGERQRVPWVAELSRLLPPGTAALVPPVEKMLASSRWGHEDLALLDEVVARQCSGKGSQVTAMTTRLWLGAMKGTFGTGKRRSSVLARCGVEEKTAIRELLALDGEPFFKAMDVIAPSLFGAVCLAARGQPDKVARLQAFISRTSNFARIDEVTRGQCPALEGQALVMALMSSPLLQVKRESLLRALERVTEPQERRAVETALVRAALEGSIQDEKLLRWIRDRQEWAWDQVEPLLVEAVLQGADVLKAERLLGTERHEPALFDRVLANRTALAPCRQEPVDVAGCSQQLKAHFPGLAAQDLQPEFLARLQSQVQQAASSPPAVSSYWEAVAQFGQWGLSTEGVARALCEQAKEKATSLSTQVDAYHAALRVVDPEGGCDTRVSLIALWVTALQILDILMKVATGVVPLAILFLYVRKKWWALQPKLRQGQPEAQEDRSATGRLQRGWAAALEKCLLQSRQSLESSGTLEASRAASILEQASALDGRLVELSQETAMRALQTGDLQSCLIRLRGAAIYMLAFPGPHDRDQALRRYGTFSAGWSAHADAIREGIRAGDVPPILSLAFFVRPDARSGSMVVGFDDGSTRLVPAALVDAKERPAEGDLLNPSRVEFEFTRA